MVVRKRLLVIGIVFLLILAIVVSFYGLSTEDVVLEGLGGIDGGTTLSADAEAQSPPTTYDDLPRVLLKELNDEQDQDGSWESDLNATAISSYTNALHDAALDGSYADTTVEQWIASQGMNWTSDNYYVGAPTEAEAFIVMNEPYWAPDVVPAEYSSLKSNVETQLLLRQRANGSWNDDVSDTALATYALAKVHDSDNIAVQRGADWLESTKDRHQTVREKAKAIIALDITDKDVRIELENLRSQQKSDGSFGNVGETAWAVMALSTDLDTKNVRIPDRAVSWLRTQDITDKHDLALAALSEQQYNTAVIESGILETGLGPPGWVLPSIIIIIFCIVILTTLFARLSSEDVMDGVRQEIFDYISENPGEHLAEITRKFEMSSSSARHHLLVLEWGDKIVSHKQGKRKHYYLNANGYRRLLNGSEYKRIMSTLKNDTTRDMVKYLMNNEGSNQKGISEALNLHPSTVNWHAKRLRNVNIISKTKRGKDIVYALNKDLQLEKVITILEGAS